MTIHRVSKVGSAQYGGAVRTVRNRSGCTCHVCACMLWLFWPVCVYKPVLCVAFCVCLFVPQFPSLCCSNCWFARAVCLFLCHHLCFGSLCCAYEQAGAPQHPLALCVSQKQRHVVACLSSTVPQEGCLSGDVWPSATVQQAHEPTGLGHRLSALLRSSCCTCAGRLAERACMCASTHARRLKVPCSLLHVACLLHACFGRACCTPRPISCLPGCGTAACTLSILMYASSCVIIYLRTACVPFAACTQFSRLCIVS